MGEIVPIKQVVESAAGAAGADDPPMPLVAHLEELRQRIIRMLVILFVGTAIAWAFSQQAITRLAQPVGQLFFAEPMEAFDMRFKVSFYLGAALTLPLLFYQAWLFIGRAMSRDARKLVLRLLPASYFLFMAGAALCFFAVVPSATKFFLAFGSVNVRPLITLNGYLDFVLRMMISFGVAFQLPLVMFALNRLGIISRSQLASWRRPFYFLSFVVGAFFTSPEVFTQCCLAIPLILLFETSLLIMRDRKRA